MRACGAYLRSSAVIASRNARHFRHRQSSHRSLTWATIQSRRASFLFVAVAATGTLIPVSSSNALMLTSSYPFMIDAYQQSRFCDRACPHWRV